MRNSKDDGNDYVDRSTVTNDRHLQKGSRGHKRKKVRVSDAN